jgi:hypothetical protein
MARDFNTPEAAMLEEVKDRRMEKMAEMTRFANLCDRFDNLYYANDINPNGGADHWFNDPSAKTQGAVHISLNVYSSYVDIPASLQSVEPIENILPAIDSPQTRSIAAAVERVFFSWKDEEDFELKAHKVCVTKGLYGRTAAKVYWDEDEKRPCVEIVDQPRNLWLGWKTQNYNKLDWAIYSYRISLNAAIEEYGVDFDMHEIVEGGKRIHLPMLRARNRDVLTEGANRLSTRSWLADDQFMIECVDYWYRKPKEGATPVLGKPTPMETWNAIFVGNVLVKDMPHPEYDGKMPYVVLFNSYIPGVPDGRSELFDVEQLVNEKETRLSAGGQMIRKAIAGQMWQLTGAEAPEVVPQHVKPVENKVVAPGAGNRIEKIEPFLPEFQLESYLSRIDRELVDVSGLNDLLRGLAPAQVLSSSKAINALVANYEVRVRMKRDLFYIWRRDIWGLTRAIWSKKVPEFEGMFKMAGRLDIKAPTITPRDDLETATMAMNLLNARIWSLARSQDYTGVDDPEGETEQIKRERTDASLFPEQVLQQVSLAAALQQLGIQAQQTGIGPNGQQQQAGMSPGQQANMQRQQQGGYAGQPQMNGPGEQIATPPGAMPPGPGGLPPSGPGQNFSAQTMIANGEANSRLLMQNPIAPEQPPGGGGGGGGGY